jgi:ornithine--oxo-acid transaminase
MPLLTDHRILAQVAGHHMDIIKLIPPLVLSESDADDIVAAFDATIGACHRMTGPIWEVGSKLGKAALKRYV